MPDQEAKVGWMAGGISLSGTKPFYHQTRARPFSLGMKDARESGPAFTSPPFAHPPERVRQ